MLRGTTYEITRQGPWQGQDGGRRFGVVQELKLARPINVPMGKWPVIVWNERTNAYRQYDFNASYGQVKLLTLFIDDVKGVVQIEPDATATVTQGPGNDWIATLPAEEAH